MYYHNFLFAICAINPTRKSDKNHNNKEDENKYSIEVVLEKFNRILRLCIIKNNEAFLLHHVLEHLTEFCDDYEAKPIFTQIVTS